jgi:hypothetical protein
MNSPTRDLSEPYFSTGLDFLLVLLVASLVAVGLGVVFLAV